MHSTVSFILPTLGRRDSIQKTIDSIELWEGDELLVVNLHREKPQGCGGEERTLGIGYAKCDYLAFIDDDDAYTQGARQAMHAAAEANPRKFPILFRMRYPSGRLVWDQPKFRCGNVGTPCIFLPNIKERIPPWGPGHFADFNLLNSLGSGWEHHYFIFNPFVIVDLGREDVRWWGKQKLPVPEGLPT